MKREDCKIGLPVIYVKGDNHLELGIIKSFNSEGVPFVCYHMGSTAACTPYHMLRPLFNNYAFQIIRKDVNNEMKTQKARRIAYAIIERLEETLIETLDSNFLDVITTIIETHEEYAD